MNTCPLQSALDMLLPASMRASDADEARWAFNDAQRQKRAEHVAWRTPQLFAQYGCDPAKLSDALKKVFANPTDSGDPATYK